MVDQVEPSLDFKTADVPADPFPFSIDGEQFYVRPWITGAQFLRYSRMIDAGGLKVTILVDDFFHDVMEEAEYDRFTKFIEDPGRRITSNILADIFLALFARYSTGANEANRPTQPPRPSSSGREDTEAGSKESASSEESPPPA